MVWIYWKYLGWFEAKKINNNLVYTNLWIKNGSSKVRNDSNDRGMIHRGMLNTVTKEFQARKLV